VFFYSLYTCLLYLILPFILLRACQRELSHEKTLRRIKERFGIFQAPSLNSPIWIHAVSYGEAILAEQLVKQLEAKKIKHSIIVTTTTLTGSQRIQKNLRNRVFHVYLPYDLPPFMNSFLRKTNPTLLVILETELWPTLIKKTTEKNIPILLANARLSERSYKHYNYIFPLVQKMLTQINTVLAQTKQDGERFLQLGLDPKKLSIFGNIKFDQEIPVATFEKAKSLRAQLGKNKNIWIAASTHAGEEEKILEAFEKIRQIHKNLILIMAPRHPERFSKIAQLLQEKDYKVCRRSASETIPKNTEIYLADTLGELWLFYAASDIAFVGGSLVPIGGHNVLEPIALGIPTLIGPHYFNFSQIVLDLKKEEAIQITENALDLSEKLLFLLENKEERVRQTKQAKKMLEKNKGALEKHLNWITQKT
jgi:3-deoxy-D-manno-octulosonic-acid transferase